MNYVHGDEYLSVDNWSTNLEVKVLNGKFQVSMSSQKRTITNTIKIWKSAVNPDWLLLVSSVCPIRNISLGLSRMMLTDPQKRAERDVHKN